MLMLQLSCFEYIFRSLLVYRALITISLVWFERKTIQLLLEMTVWEFRNVQCNAARIRPADRRSQRDAGKIQQKWGKFDAQEITALKDRDDLVAKLQVKYQLDKLQAQRDVDAFAKGRQL